MKTAKICRSLIFILALAILSGCSPKTKQPENKTVRIVAAIFPAWDWTREILGENPAGADLTLLLDSGVDLHSYQPSVEDILTISNADLFIYVGGESDRWVTDALKQANNPNIRILRMLETLGEAAREEQVTEGMQTEEDEEEAEAEYDEHVWLSLRNAAIITDAIAAELSDLDPEHADVYRTNAGIYQEKLKKLDEQYTQEIRQAKLHVLLFGDRFPFRYLTEDYGLDYYAAFPGCSAETEASFETISFLAQKCDELRLPAVLSIEGSDKRIPETIIRNTQDKNQKILTLDSMQAVSAAKIREGITYLSIMENDLEILKQALGVN